MLGGLIDVAWPEGFCTQVDGFTYKLQTQQMSSLDAHFQGLNMYICKPISSLWHGATVLIVCTYSHSQSLGLHAHSQFPQHVI